MSDPIIETPPPIEVEVWAGSGGAPLSDDTPEDLGTASAGVSVEASRSDHVHAMPSAGDVGADVAGAAAAVAGDLLTHESLTTTAHGGIVGDTDARLTDARTPLAHTHGQSDVTGLVADMAGKQPLDSDLTAIAALSTTAFGRSLLEVVDAAGGRAALSAAAASHVHSGADITSGVVDPARLGSGTPDASKVLRGDGAWGVERVVRGPDLITYPGFYNRFPVGVSTSAYHSGMDQILWQSFATPTQITLSEAGVEHIGSPSSAVARLMLASDVNFVPGVFVADLGTVDLSTTAAVKMSVIPGGVVLAPGTHWIGVRMEGTGSPTLLCSTSVPNSPTNTPKPVGPVIRAQTPGSPPIPIGGPAVNALPDPFNGSTYAPIIFIRRSA